MTTSIPNLYDKTTPPFKVDDLVVLDGGAWEDRQGEEAVVTEVIWWGLTWKITVLCQDGETEILDYEDCGNPEKCCSSWAYLAHQPASNL